MSTPRPRRCSARWLDGDCPAGVLAIIDRGADHLAERFDVVFAETAGDGEDTWLTYLCADELGRGYYGEMKAYEMAAYRYRVKHRYAKWSTLPEAVKAIVRADLQMA